MASYYLGGDENRTGPFAEAEIVRRIEDGSLRGNDLCRREDSVDWLPVSTVRSVTTAEPSQAGPLFLYIPVARLILMSILSFGLSEMYWLYRNWQYVQRQDSLRISPSGRAIFGVFYCHNLLRRIHEDKDARSLQIPTFSPNGLATGWVVLIIVSNVLSRVPGVAATMIAAFIPSFLCLVNERRAPGQRYNRWTWGQIVLLVFGVIIWALLLVP